MESNKVSIVSDDKHEHHNFHTHDAFVMSTITLPTEATMEDYDVEDDSPYEEVRASVSNTDDPDMPVSTFRMWFLGLFLSLIGGGINTFFNFRQPSRYVVSLVVLLFAFPLGKGMAMLLPIRQWKLPRILGGYSFSLNPGPFNIKEHVAIYMMANVSVFPVYSLNVLVVLEKYYDIHWGMGFGVTFTLATQATGFALAGIAKRMLIKPASLIWPQTLVTSTLLNTLHAEEDFHDPSNGISRYRWFVWVSTGAFLWHWVPGYLFTGLSYFSFICWAAPNNIVINQLFGARRGLGMGLLTFDWSMISWLGSPLMIPWWAEVHVWLGFMIGWWIVLPILYYTNTFHLAHMPMGDTNSYDRFGNRYNFSRVLTQQQSLNVTAYEEYSELYMTPPYIALYLITFALSTCIITHTILYHGQTLWRSFRKLDAEEEDIHARLMKAYPEVPALWYWGVLATFFILAVVAVERWPTTVPVFALIVAVAIPAVYMLPAGLIYAVTGQNLSLTVVSQIVPGAMIPGNPIANMVFKCYAAETLYSAQLFTQDLKLGHYLKIPPRISFKVQLVASILSSITQVAVKTWLFSVVKDICDENQKESLTCPRNRVFFNASAIWGLMGPARQFGQGAPYNIFLYVMVVGALAPIPFWMWQRRFPTTRLKFINLPVLLNGPTFAPPATGINYASWFVVGYIFQRFLRKRNFRWWSKFNYITSAALDSGTIISVLVIFITVQRNSSDGLKWIGNELNSRTLDGAIMPVPLRSTPPEGFAPAPNGEW